MKKLCILITGGAGFIGSHTTELFLEKGHTVIVLDNLFSGKLSNLNLQHPNLEFIQGDILDQDLLAKLIPRVDVVLHLAAISSVDYSVQYPISCLQTNTQGFLQLLEVLRQSNSVRLVYASSAAVYGDSKILPHCDKSVCTAAPLSPYALQKSNVEEYAALYSRLYAVHSLGLRYFNVYGVRQDPNSPYAGVISRFVNAYLQDQPITIFGNGLQSRDFVYVRDVAQANYLAVMSSFTGVLNIGTGHATTLLDLISTIEKLGNRKTQVSFAPARTGEIIKSYAEVSLAKEKMDFAATYSLSQGLEQMMG